METFVISMLMLLGVVLLVVEIALIPGIGITGIVGVVSLLASVCYAFYSLGTLAGWITVLIAVVVAVTLFVWAVYGKSIDKVALKRKIESTVEDPDARGLKKGDRGVASARLALIGEAIFYNKRVEVKSCDGFIDEGTEIEIDDIRNGVILVKTVK